jgi:hypothetical protein
LREREDFREEVFRDERPFEPAFFFGTRAPARRASDKPIAIACLRLVTFLPEPPLRRVPRFFSFITFATLRPADLLYLRGMGACLSMGLDAG